MSAVGGIPGPPFPGRQASPLRSIRHMMVAVRRITATWAIFEPRSNTTRRATFQSALPEALKNADGVIMASVAKMDQLPPDDRLDPEQVVKTIRASGVPAFYEPKVDDILNRVRPLAKPGDVIVVFSNGGFEGIHRRLLTELAAA